MCKAIIPPKNVFIVGGFDSMVWGNFQRNLNDNGIKIGGHYHKGDVLRAIPADCDGVIIMYDMVSHTVASQAVEMAKKRDIPLVWAPRKWSVALALLRKQGFLPKEPPEEKSAERMPDTIPEKKVDSSPVGIAMAIIEADPERVRKPQEILAVMKGEGKEIEQAVIDAIAETRRVWNDRSTEARAARKKSVKTWLELWIRRAMEGKDEFPSFESFRKRSRDLFGVTMTWDLVKEVRTAVLGPWATNLEPLGKMTGWFNQKSGEDLFRLLVSGEIKGLKTGSGWQTSKTAVEEWLETVKEKEKEKEPARIPVPSDLDAFCAAVEKAVRAAVAPLEEHLLFLQLQVEDLQNKMSGNNVPLRFRMASQEVTLEPISEATPGKTPV